jgi:hypothetical protein
VCMCVQAIAFGSNFDRCVTQQRRRRKQCGLTCELPANTSSCRGDVCTYHHFLRHPPGQSFVKYARGRLGSQVPGSSTEHTAAEAAAGIARSAAAADPTMPTARAVIQHYSCWAIFRFSTSSVQGMRHRRGLPYEYIQPYSRRPLRRRQRRLPLQLPTQPPLQVIRMRLPRCQSLHRIVLPCRLLAYLNSQPPSGFSGTIHANSV